MILALLATLNLAAATPVDAVPEATDYVAGHQLPRADGLHIRWDPERSWGASTLVSTIEDVSLRLAWILPDADPLVVGDMSKEGGGWLWGHKTHDRGVDADIGLFYDNGKQSMGGFVDVTPERLDVAATWRLISELLDTDQVQFMLLDQVHIDALRAHLLDDLGMSLAEVEPIFPTPDKRLPWALRGVVRHAPSHRSHLHVRIRPKTDES